MRREYPEAPVAAVGAVVVDGGKVLLVRRGRDPSKGEWSLPGGAVELGETLEEAVCREVLEETGLRVEVVRMVEVLDRIIRDPDGRVLYHYVLIDYACRVRGGTLSVSSDAEDAVWWPQPDIHSAGLAVRTAEVIAKAFNDGQDW